MPFIGESWAVIKSKGNDKWHKRDVTSDYFLLGEFIILTGLKYFIFVLLNS